MAKRQPINSPPGFVPSSEDLRIENQEDPQIITLSTNFEILEGQVFRFNEDTVGVAIESGKTAEIKLRRPKSDELLEVRRINTIPFSNIPDPLSAWSIEELGKIEAQCRLQSDVDKGRLGWTLSYKAFGENQPQKKILQYHDFFNRGVCRFDGQGEWRPGLYRIDVGLFDLATMQPVSYKTKEWNLTYPQSVIGCGEGYKKPALSFL